MSAASSTLTRRTSVTARSTCPKAAPAVVVRPSSTTNGSTSRVERGSGGGSRRPIWLALETGPSTFWIVDAFPGDAERQAHLDNAVPAASGPRADELLAEPPTILPAIVLGAKPA